MPEDPSAFTAKVEVIRAGDYAPGRTPESHIFLVGNLGRPTDTPYFRESRLEWIVCRYQAGEDGRPHWHESVTEYEMVLEGRVGYFEIATEQMHWFDPGDFFRIPPRACVKRIVPMAAGTIAVKVPSNPEKVHCCDCSRDCPHRLEKFHKKL